MSGTSLSCSQCGKALALADALCPACGRPVPPTARQALLAAKADGFFEAGRYDEAARVYLQLLQDPPPAAEGKLWWRKRALSLQRSGASAQEEAVARAFEASLKLDDSDALSHQLWIDALSRQGQLAQAREHYLARSQADPGDTMALRQLQVLKLAADMATLAKPSLDLDAGRKMGFLEKVLRPTAGKRVVVLVSVIGSLFAMFAGNSFLGSEGTEALPGMASVGSLFADPWLNGFSALAGLAYLWWARGQDRG